MFRRLAALNEGYDEQQNQYIQNQTYRFNTLIPNLIPSTTTAPPQIMAALQGVNPMTGDRTNPVTNAPRGGNLLQSSISQPKNIFYSGWTDPLPPPPPSNNLIIDKCKQIKSCADLADPIYRNSKGELMCGFCTTSLQGVPINNKGEPLFSGAMNGCTSIVTDPNSDACKPADSPASFDPRSHKERICEPNENGFLSSTCLLDVLQDAGCNDRGSIALALKDNLLDPNPSNILMKLDAASVYNQRNQEDPFTLSRVKGTNQTRAFALSEFQKIRNNANKKSPVTQLDAAARDLCLNKGDIASYDFCTELLPSTPLTMSSKVLECLQTEFLKRGGTRLGKLYPSKNTLSYYLSKKTWGEALQSMDVLNMTARGISNGRGEGFVTKETAYTIQRKALDDLRGILTDKPMDIPIIPGTVNPGPLPPNVPRPKPVPQPGVDVFWFWNNKLMLCTVESSIPVIGSGAKIPNAANVDLYLTEMVAMTNILSNQMDSVKFKLGSDSSIINQQIVDNANTFNIYNIVLNRKLDVATQTPVNTLNNLMMRGDTVGPGELITNKDCWYYTPNNLNLLKIRWTYEDRNDWTKQRMSYEQVLKCYQGSISTDFKWRPLSGSILTREKDGPFLMYEVVNNTFADRRCPERFQAITTGEFKNGPTDILRCPVGKAGFMNLTGSLNATCSLPNIAYTAWQTTLFTFRLNAIPVGGVISLCSIIFNNTTKQNTVNVALSYSGSSQAKVIINGTFGLMDAKTNLDKGKWYVCVINRNSMNTAMSFSFYELDVAKRLQVLMPGTDLSVAGTGSPTTFNTTIGGSSMAGLDLDVASWHFFNTSTLTASMIQTSANDDWTVTV